jgi:hypothetical protein
MPQDVSTDITMSTNDVRVNALTRGSRSPVLR